MIYKILMTFCSLNIHLKCITHYFLGSDEFMCLQELVFETANLEDEIESCRKKAKEESESTKIKNRALVEYDNSVQDIIKLQDNVIAMQHEIISSGSFLGGLLSLSEKNAILSCKVSKSVSK